MKKARSLQLAYGCILLLFLGLIYGWSVFVAPLEAEFGWARSQTSLVFTFSMSFFCIGGMLSGLLLRKISHRMVMRSAAVLLLLGFFFSSRVQSLWGIYISYGVLCGLGVGLGYNATLSTIVKWFPEKPGFCTGGLLLGFGVGALLLGSLATTLIGLFGWRITFIVFAVVFALVTAVCAQLIRVPDASYATQLQALAASAVRKNTVPVQDRRPSEMVKLPSFWILFLWATLFAMVGLAVIGQAVPIAMEIGISAALATTIAGMISVCNGISRLMTGTLFDKLGRNKTMLINACLFFLAMPVLYFALQTKSSALLIAGFALTGFAYGGVPPLTSVCANSMYGSKYYAINFGVINFDLIPSAIIGPIIASTVLEATGSYATSFLILLGICVPATCFIFLLRKAK